jgi:hypothetical protein
MATYDTTDRYALRALTGTSLVSEIDTGFEVLRDDVSDKLTPFDSGALASRPVSTPGSPGKSGRIYKATDTKQVFQDHGTGWDELPVILRGSKTWDPGSLSNGISTYTQVPVTGAVAGDLAVASFPDLTGECLITANVDAAGGLVNVTLVRIAAGAGNYNPASGTVRVIVFKAA